MIQPTENPFRNFRHTASLAGMPVFVFTLILMLASLQPDGGLVFNRSAAALIVSLLAGAGVGLISVPIQVGKKNENYETSVRRRYMAFVIACSVTGTGSVIWLAVVLLRKWLMMNMQVLMIGMAAGMAVALLVSAVLWRLLGRRGMRTEEQDRS